MKSGVGLAAKVVCALSHALFPDAEPQCRTGPHLVPSGASGRKDGFGYSPKRSRSGQRPTTDHIFPVCSSDFCERNRLQTPDNLNEHFLISVLGYEGGWNAWLKAAGVAGRQVVRSQQADTSLMAFELAAQGLGVALARSSLARKDLESGRLVRPFALTIGVREAFFLMSSSPELEYPHAATFRNWILTQVDHM